MHYFEMSNGTLYSANTVIDDDEYDDDPYGGVLLLKDAVQRKQLSDIVWVHTQASQLKLRKKYIVAKWEAPDV